MQEHPYTYRLCTVEFPMRELFFFDFHDKP
jgi:hypothetical protein